MTAADFGIYISPCDEDLECPDPTCTWTCRIPDSLGQAIAIAEQHIAEAHS